MHVSSDGLKWHVSLSACTLGTFLVDLPCFTTRQLGALGRVGLFAGFFFPTKLLEIKSVSCREVSDLSTPFWSRYS